MSKQLNQVVTQTDEGTLIQLDGTVTDLSGNPIEQPQTDAERRAADKAAAEKAAAEKAAAEEAERLAAEKAAADKGRR